MIASLAGGPSSRSHLGFVGHCVTMDTTLNKEVENWKTETFDTKLNCDVLRFTNDERALKCLKENTNFRVDLDH